MQEFRLNTVTYGEASSAYLAIKCVRQLAEQAKHEYPIATRVILDEMYVNDIMTGADNVQGIIVLQRQLTAYLLHNLSQCTLCYGTMDPTGRVQCYKCITLEYQIL